MLNVKDFQVAGAGDCRMGRLLPTQAGDEPLASRSLRPRYISPSPPLDSSFGARIHFRVRRLGGGQAPRLATRCYEILAVRQELRTRRDRTSTIFVTKLRRLWRNGLRSTT